MIRYSSLRDLLLIAVLSLVGIPQVAEGQSVESIWYTPGSGARRLNDARLHIDNISIIAPQAYHATAEGEVVGEVSDSLLLLAKTTGTHVMPLILNSGFNQETVRSLLNSPPARAECVRQMVALGMEDGYWGWQFDFENVHISDRDSLSVFFEEAALALHAAGMTISIAVVPTDGTSGKTSFTHFMRENWRGSFDVARLAKVGDFISLMTYSQHGSAATPGPVGGLPWMRQMIDYALSEGVSIEKISLGIPSYSGYWYSHYNETRGAGVAGQEIGFGRVTELLENPGITIQWLAEQGVRYAFWENSGLFEWVFIEDQLSLSAKMGLFNEYPALRGISVWVLGAEDPRVWDVIADFTERKGNR